MDEALAKTGEWPNVAIPAGSDLEAEMRGRGINPPFKERSDWHEIDAAWDAGGYASEKLMALGETSEWIDLVDEASKGTHATAEEIWDGMAAALRGYLEALDDLKVVGA